MFNSLQVGRALAALLVVLHHATLDSGYFYGVAFSDFWKFGNIGVDFFFVLSGFIIYWAHKEDQTGFSAGLLYLYKRIVRIWPPFILISMVMLVAYSLLPNLTESNRNISVLSSLILIPQESASPALSVSWTLMHEMLFYLSFLIFFFLMRPLFYAFLSVWSISILLYPLVGGDEFIGNFIFNMHNIQFILGVLLAFAFCKYERILISLDQYRLTSFCVLFLSILSLVMFVWLRDFLYLFFGCYISLITGLIFFFVALSLLCLEKNKLFSGLFECKFLLFLGAASYSIYLVHNPAISILNRLAHKVVGMAPWLSIDLVFVVVSFFATIIGVLYFVFWERPILSLIKSKFTLRTRLLKSTPD